MRNEYFNYDILRYSFRLPFELKPNKWGFHSIALYKVLIESWKTMRTIQKRAKSKEQNLKRFNQFSVAHHIISSLFSSVRSWKYSQNNHFHIICHIDCIETYSFIRSLVFVPIIVFRCLNTTRKKNKHRTIHNLTLHVYAICSELSVTLCVNVSINRQCATYFGLQCQLCTNLSIHLVNWIYCVLFGFDIFSFGRSYRSSIAIFLEIFWCIGGDRPNHHYYYVQQLYGLYLFCRVILSPLLLSDTVTLHSSYKYNCAVDSNGDDLEVQRQHTKIS